MSGASGRPAAYRRLATGGISNQRIRLWQIAVGVLAGNLLLHQLPLVPGPVYLVAATALAVTIGRSLPLIAIPVLAFCWTGLVADAGLQSRWPAGSDGKDIELIGWIDRLPARDAGRTVFSLRVVEAATAVPIRRVRLSWYDPAPELAAGQTLAIEARLRSPRGLANPGGFDYERWLFVERLDATGYVRQGGIDASARPGLAARWLQFRAELVERLTRMVSGPDAAVLIQALALGERGGFLDRHWSVLQRTGTSHLVAVSGLHIGMIAALSFLVALRLALRMPYAIARCAHSLAAAFSLVPATVYAALAGFTLPTQRALVMLFVIQSLVIARRRWPIGSGLGLALILIVILDPLATLTVSFWLSFGAVALLLAASASFTQPLAPDRPRWFVKSVGFLRLQWALTLGLAPLVVWFFGQFSLVSLLVNLVAIPLFALIVVPLAMLTALVAAVGSDGLGMARVTGAIAETVWRSLDYAAAGRFAAVQLPRSSLILLLIAVTAIAMSVTRHRLPGRRLALLGLVPLLLDHSEPPEPGFARATILDVGHGLAVAIETATHLVLYDAGPTYRSGFDAGEEIVAPALSAISRRPVDLMIVSHGDSDHAGGAAAILAAYPDSAVLAGSDVDQLSGDRCLAGQSWSFDQVEFNVLHPAVGSTLEGNDSSCVVSMRTESGSLLLTGDIESRGESALAGNEALKSDVVVVPHHGSLTSSGAALVRSVSPKLAIVSAGYNNRWNFPRPEVQRRWQNQGAELLVTGEVGAVTVSFEVDGITVSAARHSRRRFWQAKPERVSGAIDLSAL
jgi:competence protein ComEC